MSDTEFCYSTDEETFTGHESSRNIAAVMAASEVSGNLMDGESTTVYTAVAVPVHVSEFVRTDAAERLAEDMQEKAYERWGEYADRFDPTNTALSALQQKIEAAVMQWARELEINPGFYDTADTHEHTVSRGEGEHGDTVYLDGEPLT